jgi:putative membrane protein
MKLLLRLVAINVLALFLLPYLVPGVSIEGGIVTLLFAGVIFTLMMYVLKPILNVISLPFNLMTMGVFSIFTNALILYLLTVFVTGIMIHSFTYPRTEIAGFIVPSIHLSTLFAFLAASVVLSAIVTAIKWLIE